MQTYGNICRKVSKEGSFFKEFELLTLHGLNEAMGRNFSLCDNNYLIERSTISLKGIYVAHYGLTWDGALMFLWNKSDMGVTVH